MDFEKLVSAIEKFFLDIVGLIIPGALLLAGLWLLFEPVQVGTHAITPPATPGQWWAFIALAYVAGHGIATFADGLPARVVAWLRRRMWRGESEVVLNRDELYDRMAQDTRVVRFAKMYEGLEEPTAKDVRRLRNAAMTLGPAQARDATIRFMHIAMLNAGVASALWLVVALFVVRQVGLLVVTHALPSGVAARADVLVIVVSTLVGLVFMQRYFDFYARAMRLPFDVGTTALPKPTSGEKKESVVMSPAPCTDERSVSREGAETPTVYLAGGYRSDWQNVVVSSVPDIKYLNPRVHKLENPAAYTAWDLAAVRGCDVVFAYFEKDNPSGYGLTLEVGYAAARGKHVILVDERSAAPPDIARYLAIVRHTATVTFDDLDAGIAYLGKLRQLDWRRTPRQG